MPIREKTISSEPRVVQFEVKVSDTARPGTIAIPSYALYYVCEDINGVCMYLRKDIAVKVKIR